MLETQTERAFSIRVFQFRVGLLHLGCGRALALWRILQRINPASPASWHCYFYGLSFLGGKKRELKGFDSVLPYPISQSLENFSPWQLLCVQRGWLVKRRVLRGCVLDWQLMMTLLLSGDRLSKEKRQIH